MTPTGEKLEWKTPGFWVAVALAIVPLTALLLMWYNMDRIFTAVKAASLVQ